MPSELEERLAAAGRELLEEGGVNAITIREVARRCNVSHGAPRRYFPNLNRLLAAVAERCIVELRDEVIENATTLRESAAAYVEYAESHPAAFDLFTRHDILKGSGWNLRSASLPLLAEWQARFERLAPHGTPLQATCLWASVHGIATLSSRETLDVVGVSSRVLLDELFAEFNGESTT